MGREALARCRPRGHRRSGSRARCCSGCTSRVGSRRYWAIHAPDSMDAQAQRPPPARLRRAAAGAARARAAQARDRAGGGRHRATSVDGELVSRASTRACPSRSPAPSERVIEEIEARPRRRRADAPAAPGRRRLGQDGRRDRARCSSRCRAATRARSMAPTEVLAEQHALGVARAARRPRRCRPTATLLGDRPLRVELLTNRTTAAERASHRARASPTATVDILDRHARADPGGRGVRARSASS